MGVALDGLLDLHQLVRTKIPIAGETRISTAVHEKESGKEFRFLAEGPTVSESEWQACLEAVNEARCDYLVASGSLPKGVPDDFFARVAAVANERGIRFVLDTSGTALAQGLAGGGVFLVKPSLGEFRALTGQSLPTEEVIAAAAEAIVRRGEAENVAVTMGLDGALLVNKAGIQRMPALQVPTASAVGAGDSFLAAMVYALAAGRNAAEAFGFGIAAGAAAVLRPGTDLAAAADITRLHDAMTARVPGHSVST